MKLLYIVLLGASVSLMAQEPPQLTPSQAVAAAGAVGAVTPLALSWGKFAACTVGTKTTWGTLACTVGVPNVCIFAAASLVAWGGHSLYRHYTQKPVESQTT